MTLANKIAIVTGGAIGIGGAIARRLAADGTKVLIADILPDAGRAKRGPHPGNPAAQPPPTRWTSPSRNRSGR